MCHSVIPVSPEFEAIAEGAEFRHRIAIRAEAPPEILFRALRQTEAFVAILTDGGTLTLQDDSPREVITGSAGPVHRINRAPVHFPNRAAFDGFHEPGYEKLFMSVRVAPTDRPGEHWLVLEHATRALSPDAGRPFASDWKAIRPLGAAVRHELLRAVRTRAERDMAEASHLPAA